MRAELTGAWRGGRVAAPPSKSMAHRALICAALAQGESRIENIAHSKDIDATAGALRAFGAHISFAGGTALVRGTGGRLCTPQGPVWCCESGSTLRFLIPLGAMCGAPVQFSGEGRLPQRPQTVYEHLFREKGVAFSQSGTGVCVNGRLSAGRFCVDGGVSSQFISGLLFALPLLGGASTVCVRPPFESRSYVQLTRSALAAFGVQAVWQDENTLFVEENQKYTNCNYTVEGDASQAAFFGVLGAVCGGVRLTGLHPGSAQGDMAFLSVLRQAGAAIVQEPCGALRFERACLRGGEASLADCPDLGPILMVLGLFCENGLVLRQAQRLRLKESDRIAAMEEEIRRMGGRIESDEGTVRVYKSALHGAALCAHNDHRVAMAMAVAALAAGVPVSIEGAGCVEKSWPEFWQVLQACLGAEVTLL